MAGSYGSDTTARGTRCALRNDFREAAILPRGLMTGKVTTNDIDTTLTLSTLLPILQRT